MGSSKTAQALMCKYNYEQKGFNVFLFKPFADNRCMENGFAYVSSRIGLRSECIEFAKDDSFYKLCKFYDIINSLSVIIIDEAQFLTKQQVNELKEISLKVPVLCYGLLTNFKTELFEGSKRLIEISDSITEIKTICKCGRKANINARIINGRVVDDGEEIMIGGDESYEGMCFNCYVKRKADKCIDI